MKRILASLAVAFAVGALAAACGETLEFSGPADGGSTKPCFVDSDCVPNDCCGRGNGARHIDNAPDCRGVVCEGTCPTDQVDCGCGVPVCRNQRCAVAITVNDQCPG